MLGRGFGLGPARRLVASNQGAGKVAGETTRRPGLIRRVWRWFWSPTARFGWGAILVAGGIAGILVWGGFNWAMEASNSPKFCLSCHEMAENVGQEWMQSSHYNNPSGVRATCADCHVPKDWWPKVCLLYTSDAADD